jgi:hypothetical protein
MGNPLAGNIPGLISKSCVWFYLAHVSDRFDYVI